MWEASSQAALGPLRGGGGTPPGSSLRRRRGCDRAGAARGAGGHHDAGGDAAAAAGRHRRHHRGLRQLRGPAAGTGRRHGAGGPGAGCGVRDGSVVGCGGLPARRGCGAVRCGVRRKSGSCLCIAGSAAWLGGPASEFCVVSFPGCFGAVGGGCPPPLPKAL